jgi:uncharacterized repeat protein (TIGR01451 family)
MNGFDGTVSCDREKRSIPRRLLLILVLGLLAGLILVVTANAYVAVRVDDTLADFDRGTFIYTGLLDIPDFGIHSVQLLPIGLTGNFTLTQPLPERLANLAAIANDDVIYVVGGTDIVDEARAEVYSSKIAGPNGELTPWQRETSLPRVLAGTSLAVHRPGGQTSTLYVVGGADSDLIAANTIYRATISNSTGQVGSWITDTVRLPVGLWYASAVEHDNALYVIGGFGGMDNPEAFADTYYATINPDGSLNSFVKTSSLPAPLYNGYAVVYDGNPTDTLYFIGGRDNYTSTFEVYFADFSPSGGLTEWKRSSGGSQPRGGALPHHLYGHSGVLINQGEILVTGGVADALDPSKGISSTVKAALVDPTNPSLRLYDWCGEVPFPSCTIGAWQTGGLLPEVRAFHGTVEGRGYVYVIGGTDAHQRPTNTVFFGTVNGAGAFYAPEGVYRSAEIDLAQPATLYRLDWEATIGQPGKMGLTMQYRTSIDGQVWSSYSPPVASQDGSNQIVPDPRPTGIRYVQYQANFSTTLTNTSPLLDNVHLYYEVPDPDVAVAKDTGSVITAALGSTLQYTIYYTNTGGWMAQNVVLTETLPANSTYAGDPSWRQVGSSNLYTRSVGNVARGGSGLVPFLVRVNPSVPPGTYFINNRVDIDFPAMIDAIGDVITDPVEDDNWYEISNPLAVFGTAVTKEAKPAAGSLVAPGSFITYTIRYANMGNTYATQAVLTDTFDPLGNYTIHSYSVLPDQGKNNIWHLGELSPRSGDKIQIVVQLNSPLPNNWPVTNRASLYSLEGGLLHTSVITHTVLNYAGDQPKPMVDLVVTDVHWTPSIPRTGTWPRFYVTVANEGTADAMQPFWIALYIKPQPSDPPEWPADHDRGYCLNSCATLRYHYLGYVSELAAGASKVIPFLDLAQDPSPDFPAVSGTYDIYVQADVAFEGDNVYWGSIAEDREDNNVWQESLVVDPNGSVGVPPVYLPLVFKQSP